MQRLLAPIGQEYLWKSPQRKVPYQMVIEDFHAWFKSKEGVAEADTKQGISPNTTLYTWTIDYFELMACHDSNNIGVSLISPLEDGVLQSQGDGALNYFMGYLEHYAEGKAGKTFSGSPLEKDHIKAYLYGARRERQAIQGIPSLAEIQDIHSVYAYYAAFPEGNPYLKSVLNCYSAESLIKLALSHVDPNFVHVLVDAGVDLKPFREKVKAIYDAMPRAPQVDPNKNG